MSFNRSFHPDGNSNDKNTRKMNASNQRDQDNKEYHKLYNQWRAYDKLTTILAMAGFAATILNFELDSYQGMVDDLVPKQNECVQDAM